MLGQSAFENVVFDWGCGSVRLPQGGCAKLVHMTFSWISLHGGPHNVSRHQFHDGHGVTMSGCWGHHQLNVMRFTSIANT